MKSWGLKAIARIIGYEIDREDEITNITTDSRKVRENTLFVAIKGEKFDGHEFISSAFLKGAAGVVTEKKVAGLKDDDMCFYVTNTKDALLKIACGYKSFLGVKTVGITGSVGKTTTKDMTMSTLSASVKTMKTKENLNNELGVSYTLLEMEKADKIGVIELGMDRKGDIDYLSRNLRPDIALITSVGKGHIEYLGSIEEILKEKLSIINGMDRNSTIIINFDNELLRESIYRINNPILSYGIKDEEVDFYGCNIDEDYENFRTNYILKYQKTDYEVKLATVGLHNVSNSLGALAVSAAAGLDLKKSIEGLKTYTPSSMRQNIVRKNQMIFVEDCYNASPDSMSAALEMLGKMGSKKRKIAVLGDMYELGSLEKKEHEKLLEIFLKNKIDFLFLVGELTEHTYKKSEELNLKNVKYFKEKKDLILYLEGFLKKEDIILIKASRGMFLEDVLLGIYK